MATILKFIAIVLNKTSFATVSSTFKRVRFKLVRSKVHKNKVAQKCVLIVRSVSNRRADEVNVWGNLISIHLEPNESEPNAFEGRADSSNFFVSFKETFQKKKVHKPDT